MKFKLTLLTAALAIGSSAFAQTKWDLPAAYPASNFHTENLTQFAAEVDKLSGGKLKIAVHANASLFKANEIKRAVQGGQAQIGEVLLVNFENENPLYGLDGIPFLATSYADSKKLFDAQKPSLDKLLGAQGMKKGDLSAAFFHSLCRSMVTVCRPSSGPVPSRPGWRRR